MGKYIRNEWLKLRYNRIVFAFAGIGVAFCIFAASISLLEERTVYSYAWLASAEFLRRIGDIVCFLMVGIAAGIFSVDFKQHTIYNALGCGVSRREIFFSKACVYYAFGFLVYLLSFLIYTVLVGVLVGWASPYYHYPQLAAAMIVSHLGEAVIVFFYMSCFLFLGMIFRDPAALVFAGFAVSYADVWVASLAVNGTFRPYWSPMYLIGLIRYYLRSELILSAEFAALFVPFLLLGCLFLFAAYLMFQKRDMD